MSVLEKSCIVGYWRCGASFYEIGSLMGISASYARQIIDEYLKSKQ